MKQTGSPGACLSRRQGDQEEEGKEEEKEERPVQPVKGLTGRAQGELAGLMVGLLASERL